MSWGRASLPDFWLDSLPRPTLIPEDISEKCMGAAGCSRLTLPPSQPEGWWQPQLYFHRKDQSWASEGALCFLEGILAKTVLPPQAPVDTIYTLI